MNHAVTVSTGLVGGAYGSVAAQAVEVAMTDDGSWRAARIFAVIDCGTAINPSQIRAQIEGGVLFGLSAAMWEQATYVKGELQQTNFDRYRVLRFNEAPVVTVEILESPGARERTVCRHRCPDQCLLKSR